VSDKEAMRRLGVLIRECPRCGNAFNISQPPRWWLVLFVDGEIVDTDDDRSPFCSASCTEAEGKRLTTPPCRYAGFYVSKDEEPPS